MIHSTMTIRGSFIRDGVARVGALIVSPTLVRWELCWNERVGGGKRKFFRKACIVSLFWLWGFYVAISICYVGLGFGSA